MSYRIKNWDRFQHYKNKQRGARVPWVKLYRNLLDDLEWHNLPGESVKCLVMLWLIASDEDGGLPSLEKLSFRLRKKENDVNRLLSTLSHWIEQDASNMLADSYQHLAEDKDKDKDKEYIPPHPPKGEWFDALWAIYPNKDGKKAAFKSFCSSVQDLPTFERCFKALKNYLASKRVKGGFIKNGSTWFNNWADWENYTEVENGRNVPSLT